MTEDEDPFRWCAFCKADCYADEPTHSAECPQTTGVYEVRYEKCHPPCEYCGKRPDPTILCSECRVPLRLGDHYTHRSVGENVYEPICLGCAAQEAFAS